MHDSNDVLCVVKGQWPFDFFPTTLVVTKSKVDVIDILFFFSKDISSILISEIARVEVTTNLFFSTLTIRSKTVDRVLKKVPYLRPSEAIKAQSIIQGLLIAKAEKLDVASMSSPQLQPMVETLGQPLE